MFVRSPGKLPGGGSQQAPHAGASLEGGGACKSLVQPRREGRHGGKNHSLKAAEMITETGFQYLTCAEKLQFHYQ